MYGQPSPDLQPIAESQLERFTLDWSRTPGSCPPPRLGLHMGNGQVIEYRLTDRWAMTEESLLAVRHCLAVLKPQDFFFSFGGVTDSEQAEVDACNIAAVFGLGRADGQRYWKLLEVAKEEHALRVGRVVSEAPIANVSFEPFLAWFDPICWDGISDDVRTEIERAGHKMASAILASIPTPRPAIRKNESLLMPMTSKVRH